MVRVFIYYPETVITYINEQGELCLKKVINSEKLCIKNVDNENIAKKLLENGASEMPQEQVQSVFGKYAHLAGNENCKITKLENPENPDFPFDVEFTPPQADIAEIKQRKIEEAKQAYTSAIQKITPDYPPDEKLSFDKQEAQALLYKQNPEVDESQILFIANLAKDKQEDLAVLVEKILQKKTQFEIYSAKYLGRKQRVEQLCKNAQTAEEAEAIDVAAIFNEPLE